MEIKVIGSIRVELNKLKLNNVIVPNDSDIIKIDN